MPAVRVAYLHLGPDTHGITRHGRLLADGARRRPDLTVLEDSLVLGASRADDTARLITAARGFADADVVHVHCSTFNELLWGPGAAARENLRVFLDACRARVVVTLHDVWYPPPGAAGITRALAPALRDAWRGEGRDARDPSDARARARRVTVAGREWWRAAHGEIAGALEEVRRRADAVIVSTEVEASRLGGRIEASRLSVIPLLVEDRTLRVGRDDARRALGVGDEPLLASLGFVFPYKGNALVIEALPMLPDVRFVCAGRDDVDPAHTAALHALADRLGVASRVRFTGRLDEDQLELHLAATDLAVCAFAEMSASASLSTWISAACPVLASDLPQIAEYDALVPGAIARFRPYTAEAFAAAARACLARDLGPVQARMRELRDRLSVAQIVDRHVAVYARGG